MKNEAVELTDEQAEKALSMTCTNDEIDAYQGRKKTMEEKTNLQPVEPSNGETGKVADGNAFTDEE